MLWENIVAQQENAPARRSKRPDFSPAQLWHSDTRLVPTKTAAGEEAGAKLTDCFSVLSHRYLSLISNLGKLCQLQQCNVQL